MDYLVNAHVLLNTKKLKRLKKISQELDKSGYSELVREGVDLVLKKYERKLKKESEKQLEISKN